MRSKRNNGRVGADTSNVNNDYELTILIHDTTVCHDGVRLSGEHFVLRLLITGGPFRAIVFRLQAEVCSRWQEGRGFLL